ncbi:MAG TPA: NF038122 family metalloprotease, partial [Pirellulales bacterium]|nr:NF038122 family metalloprotease [Pirellulales bacterium]
EYNFWFAVATAANTLVVDKSAPAGGTGSLASPFSNIPSAFAAATARNSDGNLANDVRVVRIVGNGGADGNLATLSDNLAYEVGFNNLGQALSDGTDMQVPKGVTVMVDAGAIFKLRRANIDVGSRSQGVDRSEGHLQVLGTPTDRVYFTSYHNETLGRDTFALPTTPAGGDWGGIVFRNELDLDSRRTVLENEGIFINYVNHANFTFGGGESAAMPGVSFSPISLNEARPSLSFNTITASASAAIGADPNSFKDDLFNEVGRSFVEGTVTIAGGIATLTSGSWPAWAGQGTLTVLTAQGPGPELRVEARLSNTQLRLAGTVPDVTTPQNFVLAPPPFTADYRRIGPEIYFNTIRDNPINGLFVQIETRGGEPLDKLEVAARFNDTDIVHVLSENLVIQGTPGGVEVTTFTGNRKQARLDGRLKIDPGVIMKLDRARIETQIGSQLIAEGLANNRVIFTSLLDDRFGASGTFDTAGRDLGPFSQGTVSALNGVVTLVGGVWPSWAAGATLTVNNIEYTIATRDSDTQVTLTRNTVNFFSSPFVLRKIILPAPGDWGGLYFGPVSRGSVDHSLITFAGGTTSVEGGFASFNAVEIQQGDVRITNSFLEDNANGTESGRGVGRFNNDEAVIYVRGAQPTIVGNIFRNNDPGNATAAISINVNALNSDLNHDLGRSTGPLGRTGDFVGNFGPLVRNNRLGGNGVNGMVVRGSTLTTQSVWDDTDIVHVVNDEIVVQNHHTFSGLRLQSSAMASLVVKLNGTNAGFTANGVPIDIDDRIGGTVQVIGTPGHPVVMTSAFDSTVGAGLDPDGRPQNETLAGAKAPVSTSSQLDIQFRMSQQNLANPALVAALNLAAATWEAFLDDPITIVLDVDFSDLGGAIGVGIPVFETRSYDQVRQLMIDDASPDEAIVEQLPTFAELQTQFPDQTYAVTQSMDLTRANLQALGVPSNQLSGQPSAFDPTTPIDGQMRFDTNTTYDFNPADGITQGSIDFVATTAHEIGHVLGFISAVDDVDAGIRSINLLPLDLFRLAPGTGGTDFTNAPRLLDPAAPEHVFFDGGIFNRAGITVAPLTPGDIPMTRGAVNGDGFQASHWKDESQLPGVTQEIGIMDPVATTGVRNRVTFADSRAFDLIGYDAVSRGSPADWRSIKLERYSNDRNVETVTERESGEQNSTPESAQPLGQLARAEGFDPRTGQQGGSDDQRRLGFEVHGLISQNGDVDVYSFNGTAGAEVWLDIDRTSHSLDSVVELVDAAGNVIARSNDSHAEGLGLATRFVADPSVIANSLAREVFSTDDLYTTNPRDAGFRMILPGPLNTTQRYFVRVRSNSADLSDVDGGGTRGAYQLQIRVREVDEIPGSTVRNADIRFASNGIEVLGAPGHSPLLGESSESSMPNDTQANAQDLGNLLIQERGGMSVASALATWDDIDWYRVEVNWANIQVIPPSTGMLDDNTASLIFDMDYADGAGRPDTNIAIFDEEGRLLYLGGSSNVTDDKVPPAIGSGMNDLSRGSFGEFDPFVGPLHLPANANKTYFVAVSSDVRLPEVISQDPAVRREPLSHLRRVVDDRIGSSWVPTVLGDPMPPPGVLFDPAQIGVYPDPWQLNDVTLYVLDSNGTALWTVDPLTGEADSFVGELPGIQPERFGYGDLAMRLDGRLFSFTLGDDDGNSGNYHELDWRGPAFGANPLEVPINAVGDDGIVPTIMGMGTNAGVQFEAMAFQGIGQGSTLWGVGSVDQPNLNYLWAFDQTSGMARTQGGGGGGGGGVDPGTPPPQGPIDMTDPNRMPQIVEALDTEANGGPGGLITGMTIINGVMYFVSEEGGFYKREGEDFEFITTVMDDMGQPIPFSGLTEGPRRVENFAYAELMFATDTDGNLYALNVDGELQPVFKESA